MSKITNHYENVKIARAEVKAFFASDTDAGTGGYITRETYTNAQRKLTARSPLAAGIVQACIIATENSYSNGGTSTTLHDFQCQEVYLKIREGVANAILNELEKIEIPESK